MSHRSVKDSVRRLLHGKARPVKEPELEATRHCPHCGEDVSLGATVCIHCERDIVVLMSYGEFARRFGSPHAGGPPHGTTRD